MVWADKGRVRDHLRVCGADRQPDQRGYRVEGSPPRVRSRLDFTMASSKPGGITSACAEQTLPENAYASPSRDHLRVCGADLCEHSVIVSAGGSPPRVRSRQLVVRGLDGGHGITSACAEQTTPETTSHGAARDHLRVCGADRSAVSMMSSGMGSPPRVRSRRRH